MYKDINFKNKINESKKISLHKFKKNLCKEDLEIVTILEKLKIDLENLHNNFNYITDPILIDSYIYEINALNMRYSYYYNLCKEHELMADL